MSKVPFAEQPTTEELVAALKERDRAPVVPTTGEWRKDEPPGHGWYLTYCRGSTHIEVLEWNPKWKGFMSWSGNGSGHTCKLGDLWWMPSPSLPEEVLAERSMEELRRKERKRLASEACSKLSDAELEALGVR